MVVLSSCTGMLAAEGLHLSGQLEAVLSFDLLPLGT